MHNHRIRSEAFGGFTLIELMLLVAIIAVLSAMVIPNLSRARFSAERNRARYNLKQVNRIFAPQNTNVFDTNLPSGTNSSHLDWTFTNASKMQRLPVSIDHTWPVGPYRFAEEVDRLKTNLESANIAFNAPRKINRSETKQVVLLMSPDEPTDKLRASLPAELKESQKADPIETSRVKIADWVRASLKGGAFDIISHTEETRPMGRLGTDEWLWEVSPKAGISGDQTLTLTISALVKRDGQDWTLLVKPYEKTITVVVPSKDRATEFASKNWKWIFVTLIYPGWKGIQKWRKEAEKKKKKKLDPPVSI